MTPPEGTLAAPHAAALPHLPRLPATAVAALLLIAALAALLVGSSLAAPALHVRVGQSEGRWLVGFHERERNATDTFRWSQPAGALFIYGGDGRPAVVTLRLTAPRPPGTPRAELAPVAGGRALGRFAVAGEWRRYHLLAPTRATGDTALVLGAATFQPEGDARVLGVALSEFAVRLAGAGQVAPERTVFLATIPLMAWLALRQVAGASDGRRRDWARAAGWALVAGLVGLVGWAGARPLDSGYLLPTFWWPWWPLLPLAALVGWPWIARGWGAWAAWAATRGAWLAMAGIGLGLAGLAGLRLGLPAGAGMALLGAGVALAVPGLVAGGGGVAPEEDRGRASGGVRPLEAVALAGVVALALGLRLADLGGVPAGLWRDEARHGLIALRIWEDAGYRPVYVVEGADLPALLFYLMAPVVGVLGPDPGATRLVSAVAGGLTPLALWWAARPIVGRRAALIAAALIAWASWSLSMSRWAFPATLDHLLTLAAVGVMWRCLGDQGRGPSAQGRAARRWPVLGMALAGVLSGLAAYAYHTGRLSPLILAALVAVRLGWDGAAWRRAAPSLAAAALAGLLVLTPLLRFIMDDSAGYNRRTSAVAVVNSQDTEMHAPLLLVLRNVERYLLMWHVQGEANGRHHAPGAPMLDPAAGLLLALGVGAALLARTRGAAALLVWLPLSLVPGVFSGDAPHAMRSLGALAPACIVAGAALAAASAKAEGGGQRAESADAVLLPSALCLLPLAASLAFSLWLYFGAMPRDPRVYGEFAVVETAMGRAARAPLESADPAVRAVRVFLPAKEQGDDVVRYMTSGAPVGWFDGERLSEAPGAAALLLLPPGAAAPARGAALAALGPGAREVAAPRGPGGEPLFVAYGIGEGAEGLLRETFRP